MSQSLRMPSPSGSVVAGAVAESPFVGVVAGDGVVVVGGVAVEGRRGERQREGPGRGRGVGVVGRVGGAHHERVSALAQVAVARGELHAAHVPAAAPGPSRRHSNDPPDSDAENPNDGEASSIDPYGPVSIVVCGGVLSIVKLRLAGV